MRSNTLHIVSTPKPRNVRPIGAADRGGAQRLWIATAAGLAVGLLVWLNSPFAGASPIPWPGAGTIIVSCGLPGFAIGLSRLRLTWWLHGPAIGFIFSLPAAFGALWAGMAWVPGFILALAAGLLIGLLIEFVTSVVFGARAGVRVIS